MEISANQKWQKRQLERYVRSFLQSKFQKHNPSLTQTKTLPHLQHH